MALSCHRWCLILISLDFSLRDLSYGSTHVLVRYFLCLQHLILSFFSFFSSSSWFGTIILLSSLPHANFFPFHFFPIMFSFFCLVPNQISGYFKWYDSPVFRLALNDKLSIVFVASPISYINMLERPNAIKGN